MQGEAKLDCVTVWLPCVKLKKTVSPWSTTTLSGLNTRPALLVVFPPTVMTTVLEKVTPSSTDNTINNAMKCIVKVSGDGGYQGRGRKGLEGLCSTFADRSHLEGIKERNKRYLKPRSWREQAATELPDESLLAVLPS